MITKFKYIKENKEAIEEKIHFNILKNITKNNYKFFDNFFIFFKCY